VLEGYAIVEAMEAVGSETGRPNVEVVIKRSGEITEGKGTMEI
jgi:hypothetical protein